MRGWYRYGEWERVEGRELQFFALDEELDRWIAEGLPNEFWPYELLTCDMVKVGHREYEERAAKCDGLSVSLCRTGTDRFSFWIRSRRLSAELLRSAQQRRDWSLNGLILVQHGFQHRGKRDASRIVIIPKIRNTTTGEVVDHTQHLKVFRALSRRIKADLKHATIIGEGEKAIEDRKLALMTAAAAEAARDGRIRFDRQPGPPIS